MIMARLRAGIVEVWVDGYQITGDQGGFWMPVCALCYRGPLDPGKRLCDEHAGPAIVRWLRMRWAHR